jgi:membrane-associated phospholipid phosphatase
VRCNSLVTFVIVLTPAMTLQRVGMGCTYVKWLPAAFWIASFGLAIAPACGQITPAPNAERDVSWSKLIPNIADDQAKIWLFPARLEKKRRWLPTAVILGTTAALIALDPEEAPYFRRTSTFSGFNRPFSGAGPGAVTAAVPASFLAYGLIAKDLKAEKTALLIGEAVADSEILSTVFKVTFRRARPASIPPHGNYWDTWFDHKGSVLGSSMPSGHAIAAFSVATVVSRRYGNHRWVPYVSYGLAAVVGFSRVTLSAHFVSDVFVGAALGYSVSRFVVLRQ